MPAIAVLSYSRSAAGVALDVGRGLPGGRLLVFWAAVAMTGASLGFLVKFTLIHRQQLLRVLSRRLDRPQSPPGETWTENNG